ncbi:unnamed protein product [Rhizophagus irregularis]|uniref:Uncharacterized protein n=1 Tax=Rhizophagus irregularis TaxID=588596 RepID=A0A916EDV3_9GLOM|nr:unnamed protein product [Rhizophagus irregularis]CAB5216309.1 unnamed protein product [Rhizophagus irregularis]CAB5380411.1 unnamed protein product [Rhizophagus irregularis]
MKSRAGIDTYLGFDRLRLELNMRKQLATLARTGAHFIFLKFTNRIYSQTWNGIPFIKKELIKDISI